MLSAAAAGLAAWAMVTVSAADPQGRSTADTGKEPENAGAKSVVPSLWCGAAL